MLHRLASGAVRAAPRVACAIGAAMRQQAGRWGPCSRVPHLGAAVTHARDASTLTQPLAAATGEAVGAHDDSHPLGAALIIGDEILTGKVADENVHWLAKFFFERGVSLARVEVIHDSVETIAERTRYLSDLVGSNGYVVTSGGIGPTHDDMTYEGIAAAFGVGLEAHEPTVKALEELSLKRGMVVNEARMRMAMLPAGCDVHVAKGLWVPLVRIGNVHVLPGIPWLYQKMLTEAGESGWFPGGITLARRLVYTHATEGDLAGLLAEVHNAEPSLAIGSYPQTDPSPDARRRWSTKLTFESTDPEVVQRAADRVQKAVDGFELPADEAGKR